MTSELAQIEDSSIELLPPQRPPAQNAIAMLEAHANMMQTAHHLASAMVNTQMVPVRFRGKADDATAAILYGAELGLNPIQSLQRVIPIHGMPSIEARTMVALLKSRGYKVKTTAQSDESVTVEGWDLDGEQYVSTWTIERADQAGYVPTPASPESLRRPGVDDDWVTVTKTWDGKAKKSVLGNMKYITDPQTMLKAKCQAEICRDMAPDVLLGISYTSEELQSERWDSEPQPRQQRASEPVTVAEIFADEVQAPVAEKVEKVAERAEAIQQATEKLDAEPVVVDEPAEAASESRPEPEPVQVSEPTTKAPAKKAAAKPPRDVSKMRVPLEKRLFTLLADAKTDDREDRIEIYRAILKRPDVTSTNDLDDVEVGKVSDQLYRWQSDGQLDDKVADILDLAALAAESATQESQPTTTEGE